MAIQIGMLLYPGLTQLVRAQLASMFAVREASAPGAAPVAE